MATTSNGDDLMLFNVKSIDFDFKDDYECPMTNDEQQDVIRKHVGCWSANDEDDLIEELTTASGWCIKSIDYEIQLK